MSDSESDEMSFGDDNDDEDDFDASDEDDNKKRKKKGAKETTTAKKKNEKAKPSPKKRAKGEDAPVQNSKSKKSSSMVEEIAATSSAAPTRPNMASNMKGPAVSTPLEARNLVRDYLLQQNRPYSVIQIHDNLHGRVAKPQLQRALDELSAPGPKCCLRVKDYGKAKIYFSDQSILPAPDPNSLRILHEELSNLTEAYKEKQEIEAKLRADSLRLHSEPSDLLIDSEIEMLEKEVSEKTSRLNRLLELSSTPSSSIGRASDLSRERTDAVETFNFYRNAWKARKDKAIEIVDIMCEGGLGKNRKDTMTILGIETDEDEGVSLPKALPPPLV